MRAVRHLVAVAGIRGQVRRLEQLFAELPEDKDDAAVPVVGDLAAAWSRPATYRAIFRLLGKSGRPTVALGPGNLLFAGMGGEISDDPETMRSEEAILRYPGWEAEYRLKVLRGFDAPERVFLFATPPAHKGLGEPGSEVVAELINTHRPRLVIVAGEEPMEEYLARTLVVCPGQLDRGSYAVVDLRARSVEHATLPQYAAV